MACATRWTRACGREDVMATQAAVDTDRISFEEFLTAYDGVRAEWVDGEVVEMSPAADRHQDVLEMLATALRLFVERTGAGIIRSQQLGMRIGNRLRVPDLLFLATEHRHRRTATHIDGPADFVIEVVSLESRLRDRDVKFHEYETAGVSEYWIIDPLRETVDLYHLGADGRYHLADEGDPPRLVSAVLGGFWIDPNWLWREPLPTVDWLLEQWQPE
jgi:Uma2 family endonuclease